MAGQQHAAGVDRADQTIILAGPHQSVGDELSLGRRCTSSTTPWDVTAPLALRATSRRPWLVVLLLPIEVP
jgi:hypothetical protein